MAAAAAAAGRVLDSGICLQDFAQLRIAVLPLTRPGPNLQSGIDQVTSFHAIPLSDVKLFYFQETERVVLPRMPWARGKLAVRYLIEPESRHAAFWGDLHASCRPLGLIGIADGTDMVSLNDVIEQFQYRLQELKSVKVSRLFILGGGDKWRAQADKSNKGVPVSFLPPVSDDALSAVLRQAMLDLAACLVMKAEYAIATAGPHSVPAESPLDRDEVLTGKRSALEDVKAAAAAAARLTGGDRDEDDRKRRMGRMRKLMGDLALMAGSPEDAMDHFRAAMELARQTGDTLWLAGMSESLASAKYLSTLMASNLGRLCLPAADDPYSPANCLARYRQDLKPFVAEIRAHLVEAHGIYRKKGCFDRAAAVLIRLARFHGQCWGGLVPGASNKSARCEILESLWAAFDLSQHVKPDMRLCCTIEVANALLEAGALRKRSLILREASEHAFLMAGQAPVSPLILSLVGADGRDAVVASNPRVLPAALHGLPAWGPPQGLMGGTAPRPEALVDRLPWAKLQAEFLKAAISASAAEHDEGRMWEAACRLLRDHTASLGADEQQMLIRDLGKAAERMKYALMGASPEPSVHSASAAVLSPRKAGTPTPGTSTPTSSSSGPSVSPTVTIGPSPLVSLRNLVEPPEPNWPLQLAFEGLKKGPKRTGPFIYAAFKDRSGQKSGPLGWVVGETAAVEVELTNPLSTDLHLDQLCLTGELTPEEGSASGSAPDLGAAAESRSEGASPGPPTTIPLRGIAVTATLPARSVGSKRVLLITVPRAGTIRLTGCEITWLGVTWREPWQSVGGATGAGAGVVQQLSGKSFRVPSNGAAANPASHSGGQPGGAPDAALIPAFGPLPMLALRVVPDPDVLPGDDSLQKQGSLSPPTTPGDSTALGLQAYVPRLALIEGERRTLYLEMRNEGKLPVERARLVLNVRGSLPTAFRVQWDETELTSRLPLAAEGSLRLPVAVEALGSQGSPADLSDLTLSCTLEYLGGAAADLENGAGVGRRCSYTFRVEIQPAFRALRAALVERVPTKGLRGAMSVPPASTSLKASESAESAAAARQQAIASRPPLPPGEPDADPSPGPDDDSLWARWDLGGGWAPELVVQVEVENKHREEVQVALRRVTRPSIPYGPSDDSPGAPPPPIVIDPEDVAATGPSVKVAGNYKGRVLIPLSVWTTGAGSCAATVNVAASDGPPAAPRVPSTPLEAARWLSHYYCLDWSCPGQATPRSGTLLLLPSLFESCMASVPGRQQVFPSGLVTLLGAALGTGGAGTQAADLHQITREMFSRQDEGSLLRSTLGVRLRTLCPLLLGVRVHNRAPAAASFRIHMTCSGEDGSPAPGAAIFAGVNRGLSLSLEAGARADHEVSVVFREAGLFTVTAAIEGGAGGVETFARPLYVVVK